MKFTLSWLKDHLDTDASLEDIDKALTAVGLEVEEITDNAAKFAPFTVAYVEKAEKHPDADRLKICTVDTGKEKVQVICGAPNAREGMKGVFAPVGSYIPGLDITLKKGNIRGQDSNGMLVSEKEMELSDEHKGIIDLPEDTPIGTPMAEIFGLDDPVIEIALTPNRADCAGVRGIARDLAAAGLGTLKPLKKPEFKSGGKSPINLHLDFDADTKDACPYFIGRHIKGVKNGPSPDWMQKRLTAIGLRPISALVDITNYVSYDLCRPLHVFDADTLNGDLHVRLAKKGEKFAALNEKTYDLDDYMTVLADDKDVHALGGIMGGEESGCTETTQNAFLEVAYFDPYRTAKTGRALQIPSDARYRFERGVDPEFLEDATEIATALILEMCGGEASDVVVAGGAPTWERTIEFDSAFTEKLGGHTVSDKNQKSILESLGFIVDDKSKDKWKITPPSWRADVHGRADIVEEILRIVGYDNIEPVSFVKETAITQGAETDNIVFARKARGTLASRGLNESITYSFMSKDLAMDFGANDNQNADTLTLMNPISSELDQMRPSILPNLIEAAQRNFDKGFPGSALFEVGPIFKSAKPDNGQVLVASGIRSGEVGSRHWSGESASREVDIFDAKSDVLAVLENVGAPAGNLQTVNGDAPDYYHPGRSGALCLGKSVLAYFGEIHPALCEEMGVKNRIVGFEIFPDAIPGGKKSKGTAKKLLKLSSFQPVHRDFAFTVDSDTPAENLARAAQGADKNLIDRVEIFDIYQGDKMEAGKKSVAINVIIQPREATLTENNLDDLSAKIIDNVKHKTGAVLRS